MIIFTEVKLKEILKKRKDTHGNVLMNVRSVDHARYGVMVIFWRILMDTLKVFGLKDTDVLSVEQS